ncbi:MAG: hypothetical protein J6S41_07520, partial [Clostridia bacterium]|nr:hypothetical protein [Clostridia bacterium]
AKILAEDMRNLEKIGLNGMNSCQTQRIFFPTSLPMLAMAETLWNKNVAFSDIVREYFTAAFGHDGMKVARYLGILSDLFDPAYQRGEKPIEDEDKAREFAKIIGIIEDFMPTITKNISAPHANATVVKSWQYLLYHAQASTLFAKACAYRADGMKEDAAATIDALIAYYNQVECEIHPLFDVFKFVQAMKRKFQ